MNSKQMHHIVVHVGHLSNFKLLKCRLDFYKQEACIVHANMLTNVCINIEDGYEPLFFGSGLLNKHFYKNRKALNLTRKEVCEIIAEVGRVQDINILPVWFS